MPKVELTAQQKRVRTIVWWSVGIAVLAAIIIIGGALSAYDSPEVVSGQLTPAEQEQVRKTLDVISDETLLDYVKTLSSEDFAGRLTGTPEYKAAARWVAAKEDHASHIIKVVSEYFLAQKVKPVAQKAEGYEAYLHTLADHHAVISAAMKTKQNADQKYTAALADAIDRLATHYTTRR